MFPSSKVYRRYTRYIHAVYKGHTQFYIFLGNICENKIRILCPVKTIIVRTKEAKNQKKSFKINQPIKEDKVH